jgi:serine/threonine protein kinase
MSAESSSEKSIFIEGFSLPLEDRRAYLDRTCGGDENLRRRVEMLFKAYDRAGFLEAPPGTVIAERVNATLCTEKPGDFIWSYKLLRQIGEGGWGIVFLAEQERPIHRHTALKVLKPGMDTKSVVARFEAERQALALMDHQGIAHVFDAGTTPAGRPFFVMEFVDGSKVTDYCDRHSLPISARLGLFVQVCDAVQHAHQKGIIHRDIKPSNILVAIGSDGKPVPKVIDFGIAKAINDLPLTDKTIFTAFDILIGTPAYMSPEQAARTSVDIDTRSDIYSLGVLLYELLTGTTPFDSAELLKRGIDEVRRVIRDEEPVRPSKRFSTTVDAPGKLSARQRAEAPKLLRELRGDLDWIVLKALEKDRARRYATAKGLAVDVQRYLSGQPVEARPPSASYKFRKLFLRNKFLFISLGSIFFFLVVALAALTGLIVFQRRALHLADVLQLESEASGYATQGKLDAAKAAFAKSLAIRKGYLDNEPPSRQALSVMLGYLSANDGEELFNRVMTPSLLARPEYSALYAYKMEFLTRLQRWDAAAHDANLMINLKPDNCWGYHAMAPLLVVTTNLAAYHDLCAKIVMTFSNTIDPLVADRMAKDCLILPSTGIDLKAVEAMAKVAVRAGPRSWYYSFFVCTEALAQYRLGNYSEAIHWAQAVDNVDYGMAEAEDYAIIAMAEYRLGNTNAAEQALSHFNQVRDKLPQPGTYFGPWQDGIIVHALQKEADELISRHTE